MTQGTASLDPLRKISPEVRDNGPTKVAVRDSSLRHKNTERGVGIRATLILKATVRIGARMTAQARPIGTRRILSTRQEVRHAVIDVTRQANRALAILTPDLEPEIYDHEEFLDTLKKFILPRGFARVRVLISDPARAMKSGNDFVSMGRRLNSYIEFRNIKEELRDHEEAFCIADESALVYRADGKRWEGMSDTNEPSVARKFLDTFDELWQACEIEATLRQMHL